MEKDRKQYPVTRRTNVSFLITSHLARGHVRQRGTPAEPFLFFWFLLCLLLCFALLCSVLNGKKIKRGRGERLGGPGREGNRNRVNRIFGGSVPRR